MSILYASILVSFCSNFVLYFKLARRIFDGKFDVLHEGWLRGGIQAEWKTIMNRYVMALHVLSPLTIVDVIR